MAKTNKELTDFTDQIAEKMAQQDSQLRYLNNQNNRLRQDVHYLTELVMDEGSFTEDIKMKLKKILDWTKSKIRHEGSQGS